MVVQDQAALPKMHGAMLFERGHAEENAFVRKMRHPPLQRFLDLRAGLVRQRAKVD